MRRVNFKIYIILYIKPEHLPSLRMVTHDSTKIIITDNDVETWNPLCSVGGNVRQHGHGQEDRRQVGSGTSDGALA